MKKALIVGINNYKSSPLSGCVNDATAIANTLETNGDGSPNLSVRLITSPNTDVTRSSLRETIEELLYLSCKVHLDLNYIYFEHTI
jgi:hypothetical protein